MQNVLVQLNNEPKKKRIHLKKLVEKLERNKFCNPDGKNLDAAENSKLEKELQILKVPESQKCMASAIILANRLNSTNQDSQIINNRPLLAKKCLDKARQLFSISIGLIKKGVDTILFAESQNEPEQVQKYIAEGNMYLVRGNSLMYNVEENAPQAHLTYRKSALSQLYEAYKYIRDYEVNPLPPLTSDGRPNTRRIAEDTEYVKVMGTARMTPNFLGLGLVVRKIWKVYDAPDPNYYLGSGDQINLNDANAERMYGGQSLYGNVTEDDNFGPQFWMMYEDFISEKNGAAKIIRIELPTRTEILSGEYVSRKFRTDSAEALLNLHEFITRPREFYRRVNLRDQIEISPQLAARIGVNTIPRQATVKQERVIAVFNPGMEYNNVPVIYYPSMSIASRRQIKPTPKFGIPDVKSGVWDGRVACSKLKAKHTQIIEELFKYKYREKMDKTMEGDVEIQRMAMWPNGQPFPGADRPITALPTAPIERNLDNFTFGRIRKSATVDEKSVYIDPPVPLNVQQNKPQELRNRSYGIIYRYGAPSRFLAPARKEPGKQLPNLRPDIKRLVADRSWTDSERNAAFNNMLQHALFLLSAPPTPFLQARIPGKFLNTREVNQQYYQRDSRGKLIDPAAPGWAFLEAPPGPLIDEIRIYPRPLNTPGYQEMYSQPIGPFSLDVDFGRLGHVPGPNYFPENTRTFGVIHNVWVVRTNQKTTHGGNETWGLDFY